MLTAWSTGHCSIKYRSLPHFWRVSFHWMDYQTYVSLSLCLSTLHHLSFQLTLASPAVFSSQAFQLLVNVSHADLILRTRRLMTPLSQSDLNGLVFNCGQTACPYPSSSPGAVSGEDVLRYLEIHGTSYGKWSESPGTALRRAMRR